MINKKMVKRLSAIMLAATLCISASPMNVVYATEAASTETTTEVAADSTEVVTTDVTTEVTESTDTTTEAVSAEVVESVEETRSTETTSTDTAEGTDALTDTTEIKNDETGIPDAALYQYLLKKYGGDDGVLTYGETKNISEIFYEVKEGQAAINSFKNVAAYLPYLSRIYYGINNVNATERVPVTVENMQEFKELQVNKEWFSLHLWAVEMNQEAANVFAEMENLNALSISHSTLPSYDFLKSENLAGLERLQLGFNDLETIPDISHMTNLSHLYLRNNNLTDLPDLTGMTSLSLENNTDTLWENYLSREVLMAKLPKHVTENTEIIDEILDRQERELECEMSVGIESTETNPVLTPGTTIPVTITVKNIGADLENVLVNLKAATCTGIYLSLCPTGYTLEEDNVRIPAMKHGETVTLQYELTTGEGAQWEEDHLQFYAQAWYEADEFVSDRADSYETYEWIYIRNEEEDNSGSGSGSYEELDLTVTGVTVSNNNIVVTDDEPVATVNVSVTIAGADVENLQDGDIMYINLSDGTSEFGTRQLYYNAETKKFEGTVSLGGNSWKEGRHVLSSVDLIHGGYWYEVACEEGLNIWTYTNNTSDKVSPVLNKVQVFVNGVAQTGTTFKLKQGDTVTVRADVTEDSQVTGMAMLYPNFETLTSEQFYEMYSAGLFNPFALNATEYDLEGEKIVGAPLYEGEYYLYYVYVGDKYSNMNIYYTEDMASLYGEVGKNPANAGLVENEATNTTLNNIASNIATTIAKDGAVDAATKANVEAALAAGDIISVDLKVSNIPANSVDTKIKEEIQKKADETFGANTKLVYLDISMNLVGSTLGDLGTLNELGEEISITVTIPAELQGDYDYKIVRYHTKADGTVETSILDAVKNADGTLTFKTDRFSTYAIAYGTLASGTPAPAPTTPAAPTTPTSPKTSDMDMMAMYLVFAASAMAAVVTFKKMRKEA